jgi:hypothetical protein
MENKSDARDKRFSELYWDLLNEIKEIQSWEHFLIVQKSISQLVDNMNKIMEKPEESKIITFS